MTARPPFDPRQAFRVDVVDLGPVTVWRPGADGALAPCQERAHAMDVFIDDQIEIIGGLVLSASDRLVAFSECSSCELWECNLVEGWAAKVLRFGPYILWLRPSGEVFTFGVEAYSRALGAGVDELPALSPEDAQALGAPDREAAYPGADGRLLAVDPEVDPSGPFAALFAWPVEGEGDVRPVEPATEAVEVRAANGVSRSIWVDAAPRSDGTRAAYMPAVTAADVWCAGPAVDRVIEALAV